MFDNLYYVGMTEYSAWAVKTSDGIILLDTIYDYSIEDEVVGGLKKLGLDPATIKYALVSHGHVDHFGGAKYLQEKFGTKILMSAADWELIAASRNQNKPTRDLVVADGQKLTLGDTTLTFTLTPGHTPGTVSTLIPVTDNGTPHLVAEWGGTGFNFPRAADTFKSLRRVGREIPRSGRQGRRRRADLEPHAASTARRRRCRRSRCASRAIGIRTSSARTR